MAVAAEHVQHHAQSSEISGLDKMHASQVCQTCGQHNPPGQVDVKSLQARWP